MTIKPDMILVVVCCQQSLIELTLGRVSHLAVVAIINLGNVMFCPEKIGQQRDQRWTTITASLLMVI